MHAMASRGRGLCGALPAIVKPGLRHRGGRRCLIKVGLDRAEAVRAVLGGGDNELAFCLFSPQANPSAAVRGRLNRRGQVSGHGSAHAGPWRCFHAIHPWTSAVLSGGNLVSCTTVVHSRAPLGARGAGSQGGSPERPRGPGAHAGRARGPIPGR